MSECRWSGWPGAWCLDCGREDPREVALADGTVQFDCKHDICACLNADDWLQCEHFGPIYSGPLPSLECPEPGSNRHTPYVGKGGRG